MRVLYHFPQSPFSRRLRLALAHKGLDARLVDARADPDARAEASRLSSQETIPVLVDGERAVTDSMAALHYLDAAYPERPLWPTAPAELARALALAVAADRAIDTLVDFGTRFFALRHDPAFADVSRVALGRARAGLELVARAAEGRAGRPLGDAWGAADLVALTAAAWMLRLPERAPTFAPAQQMVSLGLAVPDALASWAGSHRALVAALDEV